MKKSISFALMMAAVLGAQAQNGGITPDMLAAMRADFKHTPADKAIFNAMAGTSIAVLARSQESKANFDGNFSSAYFRFKSLQLIHSDNSPVFSLINSRG